MTTAVKKQFQKQNKNQEQRRGAKLARATEMTDESVSGQRQDIRNALNAVEDVDTQDPLVHNHNDI